jgi:hypothetical protein
MHRKFYVFYAIVKYRLKFKQQSYYVNLINSLSHTFKDTCRVKILLELPVPNYLFLFYVLFMIYIYIYIYIVLTALNISVFEALQTYKFDTQFCCK